MQWHFGLHGISHSLVQLQTNKSPLNGVESFSTLRFWILQKLSGQLPGLPLWSVQLCIQKGSQGKRHLQGQIDLPRATRNESKWQQRNEKWRLSKACVV